MLIRTKIICTIGPAVNTFEKILGLIEAGMNVARLNFSHGTHDSHGEVIQLLKQARQQTGKPLAIMLDTKGPEIRLGRMRNNEVMLVKGQRWLLQKEEVEGDEQRATIRPGDVLSSLEVGQRILFDDGYIASHLIEKTPDGVIVEIENGGKIRSGKGVNVPYATLNLPAVTPKDIDDICFGCHQDIDIIAASFVRSPDHVMEIKKLLAEENKSDILILAKIENHEGVENFDSIIQVADGIMIARGDLGVEVPISQVPRLQKRMIRQSYLAGKISVTATQMLESMIQNPRPTRAEVSDVANAIYDSTSAVMLSGETAAGNYPIEAVQVMRSIVQQAEEDFDYGQFFTQHSAIIYHDVPSALTLAAVKTAYSSGAQAIFAFTQMGGTARLLSRLRPRMPIIAMTPHAKAFHQMALVWGAVPVLGEVCQTVEESFTHLGTYALAHRLVGYGDLVVVTAGAPFGVSGTTNMMMVESIGDVLVRGHQATGVRVYGNISIALTADSKQPYQVRNQLLVITRCDPTYLPLIQEASGIILENHVHDSESERFLLEMAQKLGKSALIRADSALKVLKEGQLATLDVEKALVYKGVVF